MKRKLSELHGWDKNPRDITDDGLARLKRQIQRLGLYKPFLITDDGTVLGGNMRLKACRELGITEVPVTVVDAPTEQKKTEYALSDNDRAGYYIEDDLHDLIAGIDIDLGDYAVDLGEITTLEEMLHIEPEVEEDEAPPVPEEAESKLGEVYQLGRHRLMCGDATKIEDVEKLMDGKKADMVLTDPPYGIEFSYNEYEDTRDNWYELINGVMPIILSMNCFVVMPCCGIDRMGWWYKKYNPEWLIAWYKGSPGHKSHVGFNDWEAMLVWGKPYKQMHDYFQTEAGFHASDEHSCPKPVAWSYWLMQRGVDQDGLVLDLFGGSGSTLIACEQADRTCYMMELDPKYCDVIRKRYENYKTSQKQANE